VATFPNSDVEDPPARTGGLNPPTGRDRAKGERKG
jgi:hypothetical protein